LRAGDTSPWSRGDVTETLRNPRNRDSAAWSQSSYQSLRTILLVIMQGQGGSIAIRAGGSYLRMGSGTVWAQYRRDSWSRYHLCQYDA